MEKLIKEGKIKVQAPAKEEPSKMDLKKKVQLNEFGELRDEDGNLIKIEGSKPTTKINKMKE